MARQEITNPMDDNNLNKQNHNFKELYKGVSDAGKRIDGIVDEVSDAAFDKVVDNSKLNWKEPVNNFNSLPSNAQNGDTRMDRSTGKVYRYDGSEWKEIQQIDAGPVNELDSRLTSQLNEKANEKDMFDLLGNISDGTPLFADSTLEMTDTERLYVNTNDGLVYYYDGERFVSTGVRYQSTGLSDDSVSPKHTTFINTSSNLFDKLKAIPGVLSRQNGLIEGSDIFQSTGFIIAKQETYYSYAKFDRILAYDKNFNFIGFSDQAGEVKTWKTPNKTAFVRLSVLHSESEFAQINEGDDLKPYEPYYQKINNIAFSGTNLDDKSIGWQKTSFITQSSNLFNGNKLEKGIIARPDGLIVDSDNFHTTDYIQVDQLIEYTFYQFIRVGAYDKNFNYIDYDENEEQGEKKWRLPYGTKYIKASIRNNRLDNNPQINKGSELKDYEPYYLKLGDEITLPINETLLSISLNLEVAGLNHENGGFSVASKRDYETKRRTGRFLNVVPNSTLSVSFDKGKLFLFEFDENYSFTEVTELSNDTNFTVSSLTKFIKITIENLISNDYPNVNIEFKSPFSYANWIYNPRSNSDNINFTYEVNTCEGREVLDKNSSVEQYTTERYYNAGILKLPKNYCPNGSPVKLILWNNGAGGYDSFTNTSFNSRYEDFFDYLVDEGYAMLGVYSWTTKYPNLTQENFGSPISMSAFVQGYKWVIDNYNVDPNGVFIAAKSAGGYTSINLTYNKGIPVLAAGLLAPAVSSIGRPFGYDADTRMAFAKDFGFEGDSENIIGISGNRLPRTEELKDYIIQNAEKMIGYNPYWNGLIGVDLETLTLNAAEDTEDDYSLFENAYRICNVPTKIWVSEDDPAISVDKIKIYLDTIKRAQGIGELRLLPDNTGGHNSTDFHADSLRVESITTRLGEVHHDVPLAFVELVNFFKRFES